MRALATMTLLVAVVVVCSIAYAGEPAKGDSAAAIKAEYDAKLEALRREFDAKLAALAADMAAGKVAPLPGKKAWYENIKINGYFQTRFEARDFEGIANERDEFTVRRLYINLIAPFDKKTMAVVTWAGVGPTFRDGSTTDWANIFVDFKPTPEWTIRVGQAPTWFGIDVAESSSVRLTPDRFLAGEGDPGLGLNGLYFAGPWDRGLWVMWDGRVVNKSKEGLRLVGSVHNGQFRATDQNNNMNVSLDAEYFTEWGQFGASWLDGKFTAGGVTADRDAFGVNLRLFPDVLVPKCGFQAEYLDGEWLGADKDGWYAQASYHPTGAKGPSTIYARYEEFDPDEAVANDEFDGIHLGYKYKITPIDEVTAEYIFGSVGGGPGAPDFDADTATVQYQRKF